MDTVRVATYGTIDFSWMLEFAAEKGFFKQNKINIRQTQVNSSTLVLAALASNSVDVGEASALAALPAISKGQKLQLISGETRNIWGFLARKDLKISTHWPDWVMQLKGKKIGVTTVGSAGYFMTRAILAAGGLNPDDVQYVAIGSGGPPLAAALDSNRVDAEMTSYPPMGTSISNGAQVLLNLIAPLPSDSGLPSSVTDIAGAEYLGSFATPKWADANPDVVKRYQLSLMEASCYISKPENRQVFADYVSSIKAVPSELTGQKAIDYVYNAIGFTGVFSKQAANLWNDFAAKYKVIDKPTSIDSWYNSTIPQSEEEAMQRIKDAGGSCALPAA